MTGTGLAVPSGDPAALRQLAAQLRTSAQGSANLGTNTSDLTGAITSDAQWTGGASNSFSSFSANLSQGTSAAEAPLTRIADAVENYANVLDVAQQKTQTANAIFQAAQDDPTGSMISTAEQYGQSAMDALDALQQAGDQAAQQVSSAADDLQVGSLFGAQGPVTSWAGTQSALGTDGLWQLGDPVPGQTETIPIDDGLGLGPESIPADDGLGPWIETIPVDDGLGLGTESIPVDDGLGPPIETIPVGPQGPLVNYDTDLPRLDGSGKLHMPNRDDPLPGFVPPDWTREDLEQVESDLKGSITKRQDEMVRLGEDTSRGPAHRARINEEIRLLRQVQKKLSGS
jgi:uncharacterized protein YukE